MGRSRTPSFFKQPDADAPLSFSLTQLHYFVTAAHTLNLTRAARECHVSQPSISGAVHHLEEMFCTQLFHRDPSRGLSLTTSGTQLQELAESLLAQAHQLESQMNPGTSEEALKVGCLMTLEALIMPAMIQLFQERSPGIMLAHETAHQQELLEWVYRGAVELTYDVQIAEGMGFTPLGEAQLPPYAILAPDSSWAQQDAVSLFRIGGATTGAARPFGEPGLLFSLFEDLGVRPKIADREASLNMVCSMVANGLGYSILNAHSKTQTAQDGKPFVARSFVETLRPCALTQFGRNGDRVSGLLPGNGCAVDARFRVIGLLAKNKTEAVSCFA